jgi:hypothetical protein
MPGDDASVELQYLSLQCSQLSTESIKACACHIREPPVGCISDDVQQLLDAPAPDRGDDTELGKIGVPSNRLSKAAASFSGQ